MRDILWTILFIWFSFPTLVWCTVVSIKNRIMKLPKELFEVIREIISYMRESEKHED